MSENPVALFCRLQMVNFEDNVDKPKFKLNKQKATSKAAEKL